VYESRSEAPEGRSPKVERRKPNGETPGASASSSPLSGEGDCVRFLTRQELAEALKISVRTVDTMLAGGELPHLRLHGNFIRFYLPDEDGVGGDDAADCLRYLVATKSRAISQRKLRGL
jgi:excisionase family DNA binding protein